MIRTREDLEREITRLEDDLAYLERHKEFKTSYDPTGYARDVRYTKSRIDALKREIDRGGSGENREQG